KTVSKSVEGNEISYRRARALQNRAFPVARGDMHSESTTSITSTSTSSLRTPCGPNDYPFTSPAHRCSGPAKLADSGDTLLVAQARGYELLTLKEETKAFASYQREGKGLITTARSHEALLHQGEEDILTMPWHAPSTVYEDGLDVR